MIEKKILKLRELLKNNNLDAFFVSAIPSITYLTNFSGFENEDRNAFLLITQTNQYILTHGIYKEAAQTHIKDFTLIDISRDQPMSTTIQKLMQKHTIEKLGFEANDITYAEYLSLTITIDKKILMPADQITETIRIKKSPNEINAIANACALGDKAFAFLLTKITEGITEKELAFLYEMFVKKTGATLSFDTIVAFGSNASNPHHIPTSKKLSKNNFVLLDFGVKVNDYCSDMTRTVFFGKANKEQKKMYETVLSAQQKAIEYIASRCHAELVSASEVDKVARTYITSAGYPDMPHSLGHGIGLLVHEQPRLSPHTRDMLTEGMVFSVEPGIYLPNDSGIRIEDLLTITKDGAKLLTNAPKHLIEVS
ncbi:MAG: aminopeptidase P family protein [Candidatus Levybacteria bacterium]|nr:aminopeptidase P family protein [Candidatus Levybacteria bacterium]